MFLAFTAYIVKILEKEIPLLLKRKKKQWEAELKREEVKKAHEDKHELEIQQVVKENKKEVFEKNRKARAKQHYADSTKKGRDYEIFVEKYFEDQGYKTKPFGILNGRKDKGVDVIVMKNRVVTLIQCKNWKADGRKIKHKELKEFLGNTTAFLDNRQKEAEGYEIKRMFVTSNDILDNSARYFLKDNEIVEHRVISMEGH